VVGVEALVRWNHPVLGLLAPDAFIALAEESGLIVDLDAWVLETACRQASAWARSAVGPVPIAVNVSGRDLEGDGLLRRVHRVLDETRLDPRLLELELTESVAVRQQGEALSMLREIRALGVRIAIDDFGTGYSMLSRLQDFPIDTLKIDQSFISRITTLDAESPIVAATVAMARGLGLEVVAEGVETEQQRMYLVRQGSGQLQGYLISRPVEPGRIPSMLHVPLLLPIEDPRWAALESAIGVASTEPALEDLVRGLLVELQRLTGLDSVYLTRIHWACDQQEILFSRNSGSITVPERLILPWPDTLSRRALTDGPQYSDTVPEEFPQSQAATALSPQTSVSVPVVLSDGSIFGTLCGASGRRVRLAQPGLELMRVFAGLIAAQIAAPTATTPVSRRTYRSQLPQAWAWDPPQIQGRTCLTIEADGGASGPSVAEERDQAGDQRDQAADQRDQAADQRDQAAEHRDQAAEHRDRAAEHRDEAAEQSEAGVGAGVTTDALDRSALARRDAASDRRRAAEDRRAAARERAQAELDRGTALADRGAGASERTHADLDRDTALADRGAGASERTHAELDRNTALADRGASARERDDAAVDDLTGAYLRAAGFVELELEMARARRREQPLVLAFVDVDRLKAINDSLGHAAGDRMLIEVANTLRAKLRAYDLILRYGGDEFVCAISGLNIVDARKRLALVNAALAEAPAHGSVTVGLAELRPDDSADDLVARADAALYRERLLQRRASG
jgi:diguanylate cyclase (GGDEF)-like protein